VLIAVFIFEKAQTTETYRFFLQRADESFLEGYFSPPAQTDSPIIFAIQGSSCDSVLQWHSELYNQVIPLGLGVIAVEKQGVSHDNIDISTYRETNFLQQREIDYELCLTNMHRIYPGWSGKPIFWGESEGGMLAAYLASQIPQTTAVLLFGTGGGMKLREEVKWVIRRRLEEQQAQQSEIDDYMEFLDEQMNAMVLDPTSNKEFLRNTYKWWASFLSKNEIVNSLNRKSLPILLIHGVEDNKIPIQSADLAAESLQESNFLTYLRLQKYGHDLDTTEVYEVACHWLASILSGQELNVNLIAQAVNSAHVLLKNEQWVDMSEYIFSRGKDKDKDKDKDRDNGTGKGEFYGGAGTRTDTDGNQDSWLETGVDYHSNNGWDFGIKGGGSSTTDRDGNSKGEAYVEARASKQF